MTAPEPTTLRDRIAEALRTAARTQPCSCGSVSWFTCVHPGRVDRDERRADAVLAVLAVVQPELDRLTADLAETHVLLASARDAVAAAGRRVGLMVAEVERVNAECDRLRDDLAAYDLYCDGPPPHPITDLPDIDQHQEGLPCSAVANCDGQCCQRAEPTCGVMNPRKVATCTEAEQHPDDTHRDAFGNTWPRRTDDKPLFPKEN